MRTKSMRSVWLGTAAALGLATAVAGCGDNQPAAAELDARLNATSQTAAPGTAARNALRPMAPLSGSMSGSRQPVFHYAPARDAVVDICDDRACAHVLDQLDGSQGQARPVTPLRAGVMFWRVVSNQAVSAVWQLTIPGRDTGGDIIWGVVPDFNGDGLADIAIGSPVSPFFGSVTVFNGSPAGPGFTADQTLFAAPGFGQAVASAGDVNGDGYVDLAVGGSGSPGSVTVFLGGPSGPSTEGTELSPGDVTAGFGATIASAGDVNGDGYGDLVVGGVEHAQVFFGGPRGITRTAALTLAGSTEGGATGDASLVQGPADVDADGAPDLYVGGLLYLSEAGSLVAQAGFALPGTGSFAGDFNGDGFADFVAGEVSPGTPDGIDRSRLLFIQAGESALAAAGDVNGDGYADVISSLSSVERFPFRQRVYFGGPGVCGSTGCRGYFSVDIPGHDFMGGDLTAFLGGVGDVTGDGIDDLVASTPDSGTASFIRGGTSSGDVASGFPTWTFDTGFGASFATLFGSARPLL